MNRSWRRMLAGLAAAALAMSALVVVEPGPATADTGRWTGTWATALTSVARESSDPVVPGFGEESVRMIAQVSIGGDRFRVRLSNVHGDRDLTIGSATVGRPAIDSEPDLDPTTLRPLTFGGSRSVTIPRGRDLVSDPVRMSVRSLSQLAVTLYFPEGTGLPSFHLISQQRSFVYNGDRSTDPSGSGHTSTPTHFYFLSGIEVRNPAVDGAVAVLGGSISDGYGTTVDADHRWPDFLAGRLLDRDRPGVGRLGVLNVALSGNAVTHDGDEIAQPDFGRRGIQRLDDDVRVHPGVRTVVVDLGLNDIFIHEDPPDRIVRGLAELTDELNRRGYRVLVATASPGAGAPNWSEQREATRQRVNHVIRTRYAGNVVDIDRVVRDPKNPTLLNPEFIGIDGVHPNDDGARAIAESVPLGRL